MVLAAAAAMVVAVPASAQTLEAARAQGIVAERFDGLVMARGNDASAETRAFVERVNAERRRIYADRARETNAPPDQVGRVYAREIMQNAPAGTWFYSEAGAFTRK